MAWNMQGDWTEVCSCTVTCPCNLNQDPTYGYCDVTFIFDIRDGQADDVNVGGVTVAWTVNLPGNFMGGNAQARLYIDNRASDDQRSALEAIFQGKRGGSWEPLSGIVADWLPTQSVRIDVSDNEITVGDVGHLAWEAITDAEGRRPILRDPPLLTFLGIKDFEVAHSTGSQWNDPEMKQWASGGDSGVGGHAGLSTFAWQGG